MPADRGALDHLDWSSDRLPDPRGHGSSCSFTFGQLIRMRSEQPGSLRLIELEEGLHCGPTLKIAVHRSDSAIGVRLMGQTVPCEDARTACEADRACRRIAGILAQPKKATPLVLRCAPTLKIKARGFPFAVTLQKYRQSFQSFAVHSACLVSCGTIRAIKKRRVNTTRLPPENASLAG